MSFIKFRHVIVPAAIALALCGAARVSAQPPQLNEDDRGRYINEIRTYKHDFLTRDLGLSREQQREFFGLYDDMEDEVRKLNEETRDLEHQVNSDAEATDTEIEAASHAVFEQKLKEGKIEMEYYEKFSKVLTPRQLLKLKSSEKKFTQSLMKQHRRGVANRRKAD